MYKLTTLALALSAPALALEKPRNGAAALRVRGGTFGFDAHQTGEQCGIEEGAIGKTGETLRGVFADKFSGLNSTGLLALLANGNARRQASRRDLAVISPRAPRELAVISRDLP